VVRGLTRGDVGDDAGGAGGAFLLEGGGGFVEAGLVSAGDGDCGAFLGEGVGDGASQAFGAAHDEGAAGLEVEVRGGVLGLVSRCRVPSSLSDSGLPLNRRQRRVRRPGGILAKSCRIGRLAPP
jgi:hypothetical protein